MKQEERYLTKIERFIKEDATNIEKITGKGIISQEEVDFLKEMNGVRNFVVHRYDRLDMNMVKEAISRIDELKGIVIKVVEH